MGRTIMSLEMPFAGNCLRLEHFNSFGTSRLDCAFTYISFEVCNLLFKMQNEGKSNFARKVSNVEIFSCKNIPLKIITCMRLIANVTKFYNTTLEDAHCLELFLCENREYSLIKMASSYGYKHKHYLSVLCLCRIDVFVICYLHCFSDTKHFQQNNIFRHCYSRDP